MGARESWERVEVTVVAVSENDGATFMRKGAERIEERFTLTEAVRRFGKERVVELIRGHADTLEGSR
jgi:hypothetical protein